MRKAILIIFSLFVLVSSSSVVLALDPMGPAAAELQKDQFSIGAEYSASRMDLKLNEGEITRIGYFDGVLDSFKSGPLVP